MTSKSPELQQKNLEKIFYPKSVAIVGANKVKGTVPADILYSILEGGLQGVLYPVSPREHQIASVRCYKYITDIPDDIDLAILVFPSSVCKLAMKQCGEKGVKAMIIISAGFKEVGGIGIEREKEIKQIADDYEMSFIGPNCLGVINTDPTSMLNASFARKMPEAGSIGFLSQSGALCTAVLDYARSKDIGFSKFVSFGNKADISDIDLLYYLGNDPKTKVILMYLEEVTDGVALMKAARDVISETGKPILIIKSGRSTEGASAAASHTGSLAGADNICDAAFEQAGIIRCDNLEEMFNTAIAFAYQPLPKGNKVAIITNAGGPGVLTTDAAMAEGLKLAKFSDETTATFKKSLPATANIKNPVDVIGDARADRYNVAVKGAIQDPDVDGIFVILTPQSMTEIETIAHELVTVANTSDKPVYASFMGAVDVAEGIRILESHDIPHYFMPEGMSRAYAAAYNFATETKSKASNLEIKEFEADKGAAQKLISSAKGAGREYLPESEAAQVLKAYGLPVNESGVVNSADAAAKLAEKIGYPVVMKVISDEIVHKFDVGGVVLGIDSADLAKVAYDGILASVAEKAPEAKVTGIYVTKQVPKGEEVILGVKRDNAFGPVVMFGLGGIFVEIFKDVSFRVAPVDKGEADSMIRQIKGAKVLMGARGMKARDIDAVADCIQRLSQLALENPEIQELDINPMIVLNEGQGCFVADAKIML